jgi:hypothetical protein
MSDTGCTSPTIHTIGDSHSAGGWGDISGVLVHWVGPKLCYSIGRDGITIEDSYGVKEGDVVVFCFGEIDCRFHVYRYSQNGIGYQVVIDYIVDAYFRSIRTAVSKFKSLRTCVYNVVPAIEAAGISVNSEQPFLGTDDDRQMYVRYFNRKLKEKCAEYNYTFVDVHDSYTNARGFISKELNDGSVHIKEPKFLKMFVDTHLRPTRPSLLGDA